MNKNILVFLLLCIACTASFAQTETSVSKAALAEFQKYYNNAQPDSIFALFSPETKVQLPLEKTRGFITQLTTQLGPMKAVTFREYQASAGIYKASFEKGTILLQLSVNPAGEIIGLNARPLPEEVVSSMPRNLTTMQLPFAGEWFVFWGGDTKEQNYHVATRFQKNAFDLVMMNTAGKSFKTDGKINEDYYAFGQPITAPCGGEVVMAVDGVKDNIPGELNALYAPGNAVILKTANNEYVLLAHLKRGSVKVKAGDMVKPGQAIGLCGNSGNSSEPHLHFHLQHTEEFAKAAGIKCYFDKLMINGALKTDYSPVKGDKISRAK